MNESKSQLIFKALQERLKFIQKSNDFNSDAGNHVFNSRVYFDWNDQEQFPAISVFSLSEENKLMDDVKNMINQMMVQIEAHALADINHPGKIQSQLIADIKQAIFYSENTELDRLARKIRYIGFDSEPQSDGLNVVSVRLTYQIDYMEQYGDLF